ncbi:msl9399 (plasmid) [Mesorhizobium japonicum MAFF 303099]|uniref:Msl9399 protein n=1 Tax=Mesorhizobium japonicum (strain LMG 29417 / CECT 9101 / MAFF 303099) TaxID=266835 RepID=Q982E1_RHILO|nr:msl9399 [Mesorhizobium japonicum MAFF 303099]
MRSTISIPASAAAFAAARAAAVPDDFNKVVRCANMRISIYLLSNEPPATAYPGPSTARGKLAAVP